MVTYKTRDQTITPADLNGLFAAFEAKLSTLLNGKTFLIAFPDRGSAQAVPPQLLGKCFFFNNGKPTAWSQEVPGAITHQVNVTDPVTGATVTGTGVRSYDHSYFSNAAAGAAVSYDLDNFIRRIADVPQSAYPPGLQKQNGISIFEHSLDTHEEFLKPAGDSAGHDYFIEELQRTGSTEGGGFFPTKRYNHAVAELIIEGLAQLTIPANRDRKFACVRAHNLSLAPCQLNLSGFSISLPPLGCVTIRREWDTGSKTWKNHERRTYFFRCRNEDVCFFWHWATLPSFVNPPTLTTAAVTSAAGMQGNNLSNPAVLYDFVSELRWRPDRTRFAWFNVDVHELCDMGRDFADHFAALKTTPEFPDAQKGLLREDALLADLLWHKGTIELKKLRNPPSGANGGDNLIDSRSFTFNGCKTIVSDFQGAGITVTTDADGNLNFSKTEAGFFWDALPIGVNMFKWLPVAPDTVDTTWHKLPVAISLATPRALDARILENSALPFGGHNTDPFGLGNFYLRTTSDYRIAQRSFASTPRTRTYQNHLNQTVTVHGASENTITLAFGNPLAVRAVHGIGAASFRDSLQYFGDATRSDQSDAHVEYVDQRLTMTPNGLVLTFTERVRSDIVSYDPNAAVPDPGQYPNATSYRHTNTSEFVRYTFNAGRWEAKHCVRFRKHGFPFGEFGKAFAHAYSVAIGRCTGPDYQNVRRGPVGADVSLEKSHSATAVKQMRSILVSELAFNEARFAQPYSIDGWIAYDTGYRTRYGETFITGGGTRIYRTRNSFLNGLAPSGATSFGRCPMATEGFNSMAQLVNQLKTGRPLDQNCIAVMIGNQRLSMEAALGPHHWSNFPAPAPLNALYRIDSLGTSKPYWKHWFAQVGVPVLTAANLPASLAEFRDVWNEARSISSRVTAQVSDAAFAGVRVIYEGFPNGVPGGVGYWWVIYHGKVTLTIQPPQWSAPSTQFQLQGAACITDARFNTFNTFANYNLRTAYTAVEWISIDSVEALCATLGLAFLNVEMIVPLKLDTLELNPEFEPSGVVDNVLSHTYQGEIASHSTIQSAPNPAPGGGSPARIAALNALRVERVNYWGNPPSAFGWGFSPRLWETKRIAFRLAEVESEAEWKMPVPASSPPLAFHLNNRSAGRYDFRPYRHVRFRVSFHNSDDAGSLAVFDNEWLRAAPWLLESYDMTPDPAQNEGTQEHPYGNTQFSGGPSHVDSSSVAGPRFVFEVKRPDDPEALKRMDRFVAWQERERQWHAMHIVSSAAMNLDVVQVPVNAWRLAEDWWRANEDVYMASVARVATAIPKDMPASGEASKLTCGAGLTLMMPGRGSAFMTLYDPSTLAIQMP